MGFSIRFARHGYRINLTGRGYRIVEIEEKGRGFAADDHLSQSIEMALLCRGIPEYMNLLLKCSYGGFLERGPLRAKPPSNPRIALAPDHSKAPA
jgi:hypothetical protein